MKLIIGENAYNTNHITKVGKEHWSYGQNWVRIHFSDGNDIKLSDENNRGFSDTDAFIHIAFVLYAHKMGYDTQFFDKKSVIDFLKWVYKKHGALCDSNGLYLTDEGAKALNTDKAYEFCKSRIVDTLGSTKALEENDNDFLKAFYFTFLRK